MLFGRPSGLIVVDHSHLKEVLEAPNDEINFLEGILGDTDFRHTFYGDVQNEYHVRVVRNRLTQNFVSLIPDTVDELKAALKDEVDSLVPENGHLFMNFNLPIDWVPVVVFEKTLKIVARISHRVFVGLPLCTLRL